jgi:hypothetical protein
MTAPGAARSSIAAAIATAALVLTGSSGPAAADPTRLIAPPPGWRIDAEQATALGQRLVATGPFGANPTAAAAEVYVADRPGVVLFATRASAALPGPGAAAAATGDPALAAAGLARLALDELRAAPRRAALTGGAGEERSWQEQVDGAARQVTATLTWGDPASRTIDTARLVIASDGQRIAAVTGECVAGEAAAPELLSACQAALATLDPGVPAAQRIGFAPAPAAAPGREPAVRASQPGESRPPESGPREPARISDGSRIALPPISIPPDRPAVDRRPTYVGAALVMLAVALWWNRRRRDRYDRESESDGPRRRVRERRREPESEADREDLHAAARGEAAEPPASRDRAPGDAARDARPTRRPPP